MTTDDIPDPFFDTLDDALPGTLADQFLIAMPHLQDPWFNHTVTFVWKHCAQGALGIVINKPSSMRVGELMAELGIDLTQRRGDIAFHSQYVMSGGPVEKQKGFILHNAGPAWEYTLPLTPQVSLSMSRDILADIAAGKGPAHYLVALGCAGWDAGQLEREITDNVWLTTPALPELIFSDNHAQKAERAAALLGVSLGQLASFAGHS
jgi:putative transcriptional regulator